MKTQFNPIFEISVDFIDKSLKKYHCMSVGHNNSWTPHGGH